MASSPSIVCPSNHTYRFVIHRWLIFGCALCFSPFSRLSSCSTSSQGHSWSHRSFRRPRKSEHILRQEIAGVGRFSAPLITPSDQWGMWTALMVTAAFGIWSEKTRVGSAISGAMVSILVGLVASSAGVIAEFLLPLAVPLLLFNADLRRVMRSTGTLLLAFLIGSFATTVGTVVAYLIMPMRSLGQDSWKIAAALMSRHIGGEICRSFFAVVGANGSLWNVINTTPGIFAFSSIQILVHVAVILVLGKLFGFEKKVLLIASNANVGGPTTACGMATLLKDGTH